MSGSDFTKDGSSWVRSAARRGRGSQSRAAGRFESHNRAAFDDGWGSLDEEPAPLRTEVLKDTSRKAITYNTSPDIPFDRTINPYKGCEHGCIYCYARPTHAWLGLSPGLDFESRIFAKQDLPELLLKDLAAPSYKVAPIALGMNTDCYQPVEKDLGLTRAVLEILLEHNHPLSIVTKSQLILRDLDLLAPFAERNLLHVFVSITTLERKLARRMEPRAATPERRLNVVSALRDIGAQPGVMVAPLIPGLTDHELEGILTAAREAGAETAGYVALRMPHEIKDLFREWLSEHYPDRAKRVIQLVRNIRGGKDYDAGFHTRLRGTGSYAALLERRFQVATRRLGFSTQRSDLDCSQFTKPQLPGDQLALF